MSLELVWAHRGAHGAHVYELAWDGETQGNDGGRHLAGLIDPDQLNSDQAQAHVYDADRSASEMDRSGAGRPPVGAWSAGGCAGLTAVGGG